MSTYNNFYNDLLDSLRESAKDLIAFSDKLAWHDGKVCAPNDARPVFVVHNDSYRCPGKIAYYGPDGWYRVLEGKTKVRIRSPKRWCEALIPDTYNQFVEANALHNEVDEPKRDMTPPKRNLVKIKKEE